MLNCYAVKDQELYLINDTELKRGDIDPIWVNVIDPTEKEEKLVASVFNVDISKHNEKTKVRLPNCYFQQNGEIYASINIFTENHKIQTINTILTKDQIITTQDAAIAEDKEYLDYVILNNQKILTPYGIFAYLMEAKINDIEEELKKIGHSLDRLSQKIFYSSKHLKNTDEKTDMDLNKNVNILGRNGHFISKNHESLISLKRALNFVYKSVENDSSSMESMKLNRLTHETTVLEEHITFLTNKISFLLDINFGMIDIEQNFIAKVFSIAAVVFLPPTLISSIYGMNFIDMPLLHWEYGFEFSIMLIALSATLPYLFCKYKRWI